MGIIDKDKYQSSDYFDFYKENTLGVAPTITTDSETNGLQKQFLYTFTNTDSRLEMSFKESFAFNGGQQFFIGGDVTEYEGLSCNDAYGEP